MAVRRTQSAPLPLSPEQTQQLHSVKKATGVGKQGLSLPTGARARMVLYIDTIERVAAEAASTGQAPSHDKVVKVVAAAESATPSTVRAVEKRFREEEIAEPPGKKARIKRSDVNHPLYLEFGPPLEVETKIHELVAEAAEENTYISLTSMAARLREDHGRTVPKTTLHTWMDGMELEHTKRKLSGLTEEYANASIRRYLLRYSELVQREKKREVVLVYMDESYIHQGYCSTGTWGPQRKNKVVKGRTRGVSKGKRLIIISAITKDGVLEKLEAGEVPSFHLGDVCTSASVVTEKLSVAGAAETADYHDTMSGDKFLQWIRNRLIPAFEAVYGKRKKMVLIMDNAAYHKCRPKDGTWKTITDKDRDWLEAYVYNAEIPFIIRASDKKKILPHKFTSTKAQGGLTLEDLKTVVKDHIESHPSNTTLVKEIMQVKKHELLYTVPYESWMQPIEMVWAQVKQKVARQAERGRKWQETQRQTRVALSNMDAIACTNIINSTHKLMDEWLKTDAAGTLKQHKSLDALGRLSPKQRAQCTDLNLEDTEVVGDAPASVEKSPKSVKESRVTSRKKKTGGKSADA